MSRVLINGQDVNMTDGFPQMNYDEWKALPRDSRPDFTIIKDRNYTGEPLDISVSVVADGVKTYATLLNELQALVDYSKITRNTALVTVASGERTIYRLTQNIESSSRLCFDRTRVYPPSTYKITTYTYILEPSNSHIYYAHYSTNYDFGDADASVPASGVTFTLYYNLIASPGVGDIDAGDVAYGSGTVKDALDDAAKHAFGQDVDLASYSTSSNKFTVPADGYIYVASTDLTSSSSDYRLDVKCGNFVLCSLSKNIQRITTFVRKGMQVYYTNYYYSVGTNCFIQYTPLV